MCESGLVGEVDGSSEPGRYQPRANQTSTDHSQNIHLKCPQQSSGLPVSNSFSTHSLTHYPIVSILFYMYHLFFIIPLSFFLYGLKVVFSFPVLLLLSPDSFLRPALSLCLSTLLRCNALASATV